MYKAFIITYAKGGLTDGFNYKKFHDTLTKANGILNWWHYLDSSYIIIVQDGITATNVSDYVRSIAPNKRFFTCQLNLNDHNGWLPQEAWDWINKYRDLT
jgi:hypothetical protein